MYNKLQSCLKSIREKTDFKPEVGLVLGSGLGDFAETIKTEATVEYKDIEGFPVSTVKGHKGRFVFGYSGDIPVVIMQGRVHYYEGYSMSDVVLPVRPIIDFLEVPRRIGNPSLSSTSRFWVSIRFCSSDLAKPMPGSIIMRSSERPAFRAIFIHSARSSVTSLRKSV